MYFGGKTFQTLMSIKRFVQGCEAALVLLLGTCRLDEVREDELLSQETCNREWHVSREGK